MKSLLGVTTKKIMAWNRKWFPSTMTGHENRARVCVCVCGGGRGTPATVIWGITDQEVQFSLTRESFLYE